MSATLPRAHLEVALAVLSGIGRSWTDTEQQCALAARVEEHRELAARGRMP